MVDLVIIGGGPAGLAAACKAWESGLRDILILERDKELGMDPLDILQDKNGSNVLVSETKVGGKSNG